MPWPNRWDFAVRQRNFFARKRLQRTAGHDFRFITRESKPMTETSPAQPLSSEEQEQLQQTVEMFEVITQANPQDTQSLEILKEAFGKLGKQPEALAVARKLGDAHMELGEYSSALLEYEYIL